ncbi:MAG: aminotransferase class V-fold PLP-dependent enzyme [Candidatus Micrarchaeota archaeon]|nr:aminotransferase class V-fold PLP-dependent enzyme [Candidatus Micrarchaeota archaeon]
MKVNVSGQNKKIKLKNGKTARVVRLNNAATTPPFVETVEKVGEFMETYGAVHRGAGPYADETVQAYENAVEKIKQFTNTGKNQEVLFTSNTTAAINQLARMLALTGDQTVLTSGIEHTSNYLPWKFTSKAKLATFKTNLDGSFDIDDLEEKIETIQPAIVAITGAHNLTGYIPPLEKITKKAHSAGAKVFVDAAQLAPHRPLQLGKIGIDYAAFSAHKLYAPFGLGVLVVEKKLLDASPADPGGGTIDMASERGLVWAQGVKKHQSGTINAVGVVALAESMKIMEKISWNYIMAHEKTLAKQLIEGIYAIEKVKKYIPANGNVDRTGNVVFNLNGLHHALVSAILEKEYGIETRSGTICNHRLVRKWMNIADSKQRDIEEQIQNGNLLASYGIVRASIGVHNTEDDIEKLIAAVKQISAKGPQLHYVPASSEETYKVLRP